MLYIRKENIPVSLLKYRQDKYAYYDGYKEKDDVRKALLQEQGYLCAYCMRRIDLKNMKIEHWKPQSILTEKARLEYKNMLGVCLGHKEGDSKEDETCDSHRGNEKLTVNPLDENTIRKIIYKVSDGTIFSKDDVIDKDLDKTLNLNCEKALLKLNRKRALTTLQQKLYELQGLGTWNKNLLDKHIQYYENVDKLGKKSEYAGILLWYLKKKRNSL